MSSKRWTIVCLTLTLLICGCSAKSEVSESPTGDRLAAASISPKPGSDVANASSASAGLNAASNKLEPFHNPFAPPKEPPPPPVVEQPEPEPTVVEEPPAEVRRPGEPPKIRLVGFMNVGEPKVLVSYRNEPETLAIGDMLEDMKVVKIESPELTMLFEEREIKWSLFDQAWQHEMGQMPAGNKNRVQSRTSSTRPTRNTSTSVTRAAKTGAPVRGSSGITGFGPSRGKQPGLQPPASSGTGSAAKAPVETPSPGLPGFGGGFPALPELDADAGGKPGAGNWPGLPGGL